MNTKICRSADRFFSFAFLLLLGLGTGACGAGSSVPTAAFLSSPSASARPSATPVPFLALFAPNVARTAAEQAERDALAAFAAQQGWQVETLPPADLIPQDVFARQPALIAGVGSGMGSVLEKAAGEHPDLRFLAVDEANPQPQSNFLIIGGSNVRRDELGFVAGLLTGIVNTNHRVGWIGESGTVEDKLYRNGFLHGVRYFCPLCVMFEHEVASDAKAGDGQAVAEKLLSEYVDTASAVPGPAEDAALVMLAGKQVRVAGSYAGFFADLFGGGSATGAGHVLGEPVLQPDKVLGNVLSRWWKGEVFKDPVSYSLENDGITINSLSPDAVTPGKQALIQECLLDVKSGRLAVGVDLQTGEEQ